MSCYHPMVLIKTSDMTDPEQRKIAEVLRLRHKGEGRSVNTFLIPKELAVGEGIKLNSTNAVLVPCGHCIGCRLDYSRQWAERCVHEAESHESNYFLSLTYDDDHLPFGSKGIATLVSSEISDFMKRLRTTFERKFGLTGIRFFGCGEYGTPGVGSRLSHPHYHIILFNCPIPDLQERHPIMVDGKLKWIFQYDDEGNKLLFSPTIHECWQKRGTAQIGQVTYESCAYVARYIVKKQLGPEGQQYRDCGINPPFVRMSRMPGIGYDWFDQHYEQLIMYDNYIFKRGDKAFPVKPGKYFDKIIKELDEQLFYEKKEQRHQDFYDSVDCKTFEGVDLTINNHNAELEKERQAKLLKRN